MENELIECTQVSFLELYITESIREQIILYLDGFRKTGLISDLVSNPVRKSDHNNIFILFEWDTVRKS